MLSNGELLIVLG